MNAMLLSALVTQTVHTAVSSTPSQGSIIHRKRSRSHGRGGLSAIATSTNTDRPVASTPHGGLQANRRHASGCLPQYLDNLASVALQHASSFRPQQFVNIIWGLAKLGYRSTGSSWLEQYLAHSDRLWTSMPPRNLAILIWSLATMKYMPSRQWAVNFLAESGEKMTGFKPQDVANTIWGLANLGIQPHPDWLSDAMAVAEARMTQFKAQELSTTAWALAKLGYRPSYEWIAALLDALLDQRHAMTPQHVSNLLWALGKWRYRPPLAMQQTLLDCLLMSARHRGPDGQACAISLWSIAKLNFQLDSRQISMMLSLVCSHWTHYNSRQLAHVAGAVALLRVSPPADWLQDLTGHSAACMHSATAQDIAQLLRACVNLGWMPAQFWWDELYQCSATILAVAAAKDLVGLLHSIAVLQRQRPACEWVTAFWQRLAVVMAVGWQGAEPLRHSWTDHTQANSGMLSSRPSGQTSFECHAAGGTPQGLQQLSQLDADGLLHSANKVPSSAAAAAVNASRSAAAKSVMPGRLLHPVDASLLWWSCARLALRPPWKIMMGLLSMTLLQLPDFNNQQLMITLQAVCTVAAMHKHKNLPPKVVKTFLAAAKQRAKLQPHMAKQWTTVARQLVQKQQTGAHQVFLSSTT
eukprot:jgi/Chrzof1/11812/Cz06g10290.t1